MLCPAPTPQLPFVVCTTQNNHLFFWRRPLWKPDFPREEEIEEERKKAEAMTTIRDTSINKFYSGDYYMIVF